MGFIKTSVSAIGKLGFVVLLLAAFVCGLASVVYMSLSGNEIKVPELTGKDFVESEKELASLGLKIKRRADRPSTEKMNTVLEQLPKAGETVKTGQMIFVVVSKAGAEEEPAPKSLIKDIESDDTKKIEDMISDKPKKPKSNSNSNIKKKPDTTRDVNADDSIMDSNPDADLKDKSNSKTGDANKKLPPASATPGDKGNKNTIIIVPSAKPQKTPAKSDPRTRTPVKP